MSDASEGDALITAELREKAWLAVAARHCLEFEGACLDKRACGCFLDAEAALESVLPALIRQAREEERERAAQIADDVAARKNAAQTEAQESRNEFAVGLFQVSKFTARAIAAAIRRTGKEGI